jgi:hypothetical protein
LGLRKVVIVAGHICLAVKKGNISFNEVDVNIEGVTVLQTAQKAQEIKGKYQYFFSV